MSETRNFFKQQLAEMGFDEKLIEKALDATDCQSVDRAAEWIINHVDDPEDDNDIPVASTSKQESSSTASSQTCKEKSPEEIEAAKKKYEELIAQRRREREEKEKQDEIERERARRGTGREITKLREKVERQEQLQLIEQRKKDKKDDALYLQRLKEQIAADRAAQKEKFAQKSPVSSEAPKTNVPVCLPKTVTDSCRLAIRLPDGSSLQQDFKSREPLAAVKLFVQLNRKDMANDAPESGNIQFKIPPATVFTDEDMDRPLVDLGLCPSSRLIAVQKKPTTHSFGEN